MSAIITVRDTVRTAEAWSEFCCVSTSQTGDEEDAAATGDRSVSSFWNPDSQPARVLE